MLKVKVENPAALHFILQDDIYLLNGDKPQYQTLSAPIPDIKTEELIFNYLGLNKKAFLILVDYPGNEHILEPHLVALESVLKRKELSLDDVAIINLAKHAAADYEKLNTFFKPQTLLILGKGAIPVGIDEPLLNSPANANGTNLLYTYSFDEMMDSNELKKAFWDKVKIL